MGNERDRERERERRKVFRHMQGLYADVPHLYKRVTYTARVGAVLERNLRVIVSDLTGRENLYSHLWLSIGKLYFAKVE